MSKTSIPNAPLPFDELAEAIKGRRSVYGLISGLRLDRAAPGEAWSSLPYRPVFVGDTETGVLHGGVVTAMLDESCGMAVQLALDGTRAIATLDLRIDYQKPATPGLDIKAHSVCYRVTRSIAFVRSTAYQESEDDPVATATACFMVGANRTNHADGPADGFSCVADAGSAGGSGQPIRQKPLRALSRHPRRRRWRAGHAVLAKDKIIGNPILPAIHGGMTGAFLRNDGDCECDARARRLGAAQADRPDDQLPALGPRAGQLCQGVDRQAGPARRRFRGTSLAGRSVQADRLGLRSFHAKAHA